MRQLFLTTLLCVAPLLAAAQGVSISAGYELRHERYRYQFSNPSSFNTPFLVPHEFVQSYTADNQWARFEAGFTAIGARWTSLFALTPQRTSHGEDYDTFFQPDGDIVVSGTRGNVSLRSFRFSQNISFPAGALFLQVGYALQRDRARFQASPYFQTHLRPPSIITGYIAVPSETTRSLVQGVTVGVFKEWKMTHDWMLHAECNASPVVAASLTTILPKKYPGQSILFTARGAGFSGAIALRRKPLLLSFEYSRTGTFSHSRQFRRESASIGIALFFHQ